MSRASRARLREIRGSAAPTSVHAGVWCNRGHRGCWIVHPGRDWWAWTARAVGALLGVAFVAAVVVALCAGCGGSDLLPPPCEDAGTAGAPTGECPRGAAAVVVSCGGRVAVAYGQLWACGVCNAFAPLGCWSADPPLLCVASCDVCEVRP